MNRMLISTAQEGALRVALLDGQTLYDLDIERFGFEQKKSNVYKGRVIRIEPSLGAAFIDYGEHRHGFLALKDIAQNYFPPALLETNSARPNIQDILRENQEILVQLDKEERGHKGAALTTFISLAGSYLVLMPNNPRAGGISRRIEGRERDELRTVMNQIHIPEGMGVIVRTACIGRSLEELQWDLNILLRLWDNIIKADAESRAPCLIYQEGDVVSRAIRDYLRRDLAEILVDDQAIYEKIKQYVEQIRPEFLERIKLHQDKIPLFSLHQIEKQIETAHQRSVRLSSGGSIVIDHTEALVSIDVNSGRATSGSGIEETALHTNIEAAEEIARQLRLRDIGGLIVIDFIDMSPIRNQRAVADKLREALKPDRARVQIGNITRFGLLEMSRQRLQASLSETSRITCPRCDGQGMIRSIESLAISILRIIEEEAAKDGTLEIQAQLPLDLATFLLNEKRAAINEIEKLQQVPVVLLPNNTLETPNYKIKRIRKSDSTRKRASSHKLLETPETKMPKTQESMQKKITAKEPIVPFAGATTEHPTPHPKVGKTKIKKIFGKIFGKETTQASTKKETVPQNFPKPPQEVRGISSGNLPSSQTGTTPPFKRSHSGYGKSSERISSARTSWHTDKKYPQKTHKRRGSRGGKRRSTSNLGMEHTQQMEFSAEAYPEMHANRASAADAISLAHSSHQPKPNSDLKTEKSAENKQKTQSTSNDNTKNSTESSPVDPTKD